MRLVKTDMRGLNSLGVYLKARFVHRSMTANPHFPAPTPTLAEMDAAILELRIAMTNAIDGGKFSHTIKDLKTQVVANLLKATAGYVAAVAQGNEAIVMSAGFELRKRSRRIGELDMPRYVGAKADLMPGQVKLRWTPVRGARMYQVFAVTEGNGSDMNDWRPLQVSSSTRCVVKGLESRHYHLFRVQAIGVAGAGPMSQPARALAA